MYLTKITRFAVGAAITFASAATFAAPIMPSFDGAPTGWTVDRYDPAGFADVGTFMGRNDVLGISIDESTASANRPAGQQATFYNTQGRAHVTTVATGSVLAADLFIPTSWGSADNGSVRTDMWSVIVDGFGVRTDDYGIIGFTNYGGMARLRVFDGDAGGDGWINLLAAIDFGDWNSLAIEYTGASLVYTVGGNVVYTDATLGAGAAGIGSVIMQAYNFGDPAIQGANLVPYTAHWSAAQAATVPEPGTLALFALGLLGAATMRRKAGHSA